MLLSTSSWIVTLMIVSLTVHTVRSGSHVTVRPTDSDPSICGDHTICDTLSNLISNNHEVFSCNTNFTLEFLQGTHEVKNTTVTQLITREVNRVSWYGNEAGDTMIICKSRLIFLFFDISSLTIENLRISNCGSQLQGNTFTSYYRLDLLDVSAALTLVEVTAFHMQSVVISHSRGYGLLGLNIGGANSITSCTFLENNSVKYSGDESGCAGGNVAFYFLERQPTLELPGDTTLSITNSTIHGGADQCNPSARSILPIYLPYFSKVIRRFKANGLALVTYQNTFKIRLQVTNTNFSQNTAAGDNYPPAILLVDYGEMMSNTFEFSNCSFEREGTLKINSYNKGDVIFNQSTFSPFLQLRNCTFTNSSYTAVKIYVELPSTILHAKFQQILILGCTFKHYNDIHRFSSILDITYRYDNYFIQKQRHFMYATLLILEENDFSDNFNVQSSVAISGPLAILRNGISYIKNHRITNRIYIIKCIFRNNTAVSSVNIEKFLVILRNSTFESATGTALYALLSVIQLEGFNLFDRNNGTFGGALNLEQSQLFITSDSHTLITNNYALYGGGIFAEAETFVLHNNEYNRCTIGQEEIGGVVELVGNNARYAGDSIFGGTYDMCQLFCAEENCTFVSRHNIEKFVSVSNHIVIPPTKLCLCENGLKQVDQFNKCTKTSIELLAFPGQVFTVPLVAIGELLDETSKIVVMGTVCKDNSETDYCQDDYKHDIGYGQRMQEVYQQCTNVTYTVNSQSGVVLKVQTYYEETINMFSSYKDYKDKNRVMIRVKLAPCPSGFEFQDSNKNGQPAACECLSYFTRHSINCNRNNGTVIKPQNKWLFSGTSTVTDIIPSLVNKTVVHDSCPYDYCIWEGVSVNLNKPDEQCDFNRSGILCGTCQANLSIVLGNSNCKECSNVYLLLIIPFALAGVALVVLLLKCNLTVSVGHINGIVFYANIVQVNKVLLFKNQNTADQIFSTFIAWLNLDLGIETCFFDNMDSYAKTWLQFVFPVYLWVIAALIIATAHYSSRMASLIGSNSVPVLATLFLLSYAKLLRTTIAAVSFTYVEFEDKSFVTVWLVDGNVAYFSLKHAALLLMTLLFILFYTLPLTLLVLLAPCLQARSHHKAFKWVNRLKPFLDAFQGPYNNKFRYWTGILLAARLVLFIAYASNFINDFAINFFWTIVATSLLAAVLFKAAVYRHRLANWIELLSLLNIIALCSVNWLANSTGYKEWYPTGKYTTYTSVAVMMLAFLGVILYQLICRVCSNGVSLGRRDKSVEEIPVQADLSLPTVSAQTSSVVEVVKHDILREPLLDSL